MALAQREPSEDEKEKARIRIGITREQQQQIEAIFADARRQEGEVHQKTRELYRQLFELYDSYEFDRQAAKKVRWEIGAQNRKRMLIHAESQERLRRVLSKDQFERMIQHGKEMREKWRRENPHRRPPPPGNA
jgi:Spy/CpxP family protein refolding chaperone